MATTTRARTLTLDEFLELPERKPALEYEDGEVTRKVSPKGKHSGLQGYLVRRFDTVGLPKRIARAFPELRVNFGGQSLVPDVSVVLWDRVPVDAKGRIDDIFFLAPDIVVEIVSPRQGVNKLIRRCLWYVANGVQLALLVDPSDESILVFRPDQVPRACRGADVITAPEILPDLRLVTQDVFDSLSMK